MKIVFLDIDGVLNGHEWSEEAESGTIRPDCVEQLNRVLALPQTELVISSAWRYMVYVGSMTTRGFEFLLRTHGVRKTPVLGLPDKDETMSLVERGEQIARWLDRWLDNHPRPDYVVLDDNDFGITARHPAVITDSKRGLTEADADKAIALLT